MRQALIDGISALNLGTFRVSTELPWDAAGMPLYEKNFRTFYVDQPQTQQSALITLLNSPDSLDAQTTRITVYVTVDAKQQPTNYENLIAAIPSVKQSAQITGVVRRECDTSTRFVADSMITEFEFRFTELKIN